MRSRFSRFLALALLLCASLSTLHGQNKLDFSLKQALSAYQQQLATWPQKVQSELKYEMRAGRPMINVILQTRSGDFSFVTQNGGVLRTVAGPYATALLPLETLPQIAALTHVTYVSGTVQLRQLNDLATKEMGAPAAFASGYTGKDVLIGVIDSGIDVEHPGFKNASGSRILYLWDQTAHGNAPQYPLYDYGTEWTKAQIDQGQCTSKDTDGHGTHVAGTLAQHITLPVPDSAYSGSAIASNLIIVKSNYYSYEILDGINYIFEKARQLGKPALINISLGSQQGPHDGLDPYVAAQDYLTGPGRIIVQSAGNDGVSQIHHMVTADANGEDMAFSLDKNADALKIELWYDGDRDASIQILAPNGVTFPAIASGAPTTTINSPSGNATIDNASGGAEYYNGDKRISLTLQNAVAGNWRLRLSSTAAAVVHAWMWSADPAAGFKFATTDNHYTLVNEACGRTNIVVGAMVTRNRFRVRNVPNVPDGTEYATTEVINRLASFTSGGPTRDGREKPDIVAPGSMLASAESKDIVSASATWPSEFRSIGPRYPAFGMVYLQFMQGTSMASPAAGGVIILLMNNNNSIDYSIILSYLKRFSKGVGPIPPGFWHYLAGYGLINLQALLDNKIQVVSLIQISENQIQVIFNQPVSGADNPSNYSIIGASSSLRVTKAEVSGQTVTLTLSGNLVEGQIDMLKIQNVSAIAGLEAFAETLELEIDKFGTIVAPHHVLTNEIWRPEGSPYYLDGRVEVPTGVRLTLLPGTVVKFMPKADKSSRLVVFGQLIAEGTEERPIVLTSQQETQNGDWGGIYFDPSIPTTMLKNCKIRYADNGIKCFSSKLALEDCEIAHCLNIGFFAKDCSPTLRRTLIWDCNGGEFDDGLQLQNVSSSALLENLTVHGNGRVGIACFSSNPRIVNCIISNNAGPGIHSQDGTPPAITYSDVWNNNPNYNGTAPGAGNISQNPDFVNAALGDFHLLPNSVCLDKGDPAAQYNDPDGTRNDMGAFSRTASLAAFNVVDTNNGLKLSWSKIQTNKAEGILILRSTDSVVSGKPQNGKQYQIGNELGNALVIFTQSGGNQSGEIVDMMIERLTKYHYSAWAIYTGNRYSDAPLSREITTTAVEDRKELSTLPKKYDLHQNYPNPFTPATMIAFDLPRTSTIELQVYDLHGHLVCTLLRASRPAGRYELTWDGKDERNRPTASGIYFIRMQAGSFQKSLKATRLN